MVRFAFLLFALASLTQVFGQTGICGKQQTERTLNVRVINRRHNGAPEAGLQATDFEIISKRGVSSVITATADLPLDIVVVQQKGLDPALAAAAARVFAGGLNDKDRVAVTSVGDLLVRHGGWQQQEQAVRDALETSAGGGSAIRVRVLDAMPDVLKLFEKEKLGPRKRIVILVAEEWDDASLGRVRGISEMLRERGVAVYQAVMPFQQRKLRAVVPRMTLPNDPRAGENQPIRQIQPLRQRVPSLALATAGEVAGTADGSYLAGLLVQAHAQYVLGYCADRKQGSALPDVRLTSTAKADHRDAEIIGPKVIGESESQ